MSASKCLNSFCECQLEKVRVCFPLPPLLPPPPPLLSLSFCILLVLCNAFPQHRQDLLYSCCIEVLRECVGREEAARENMFLPVCVPAHVCVSVLQSSVAMATLGTRLRQLCGPALPESCCRKPCSLAVVEKCTHADTFFHVNHGQTDGHTVSNPLSSLRNAVLPYIDVFPP